MESPIIAFLEWYRSLPVPHRNEIAAFMVEFNPGYEGVDAFELDTLIDKFETKLKGYSEDKFLGVGMALSLRAILNSFSWEEEVLGMVGKRPKIGLRVQRNISWPKGKTR